MLPKLTASQLLDILADTEYDARRYSGGGFGTECVGFTVDDGKDLFAVAQIVSRADEALRPLLVSAFQFAKADGLGRSSVVVYFPHIAWPADAKEKPFVYEFDDRDTDEDWEEDGDPAGGWESEDD